MWLSILSIISSLFGLTRLVTYFENKRVGALVRDAERRKEEAERAVRTAKRRQDIAALPPTERVRRLRQWDRPG